MKKTICLLLLATATAAVTASAGEPVIEGALARQDYAYAAAAAKADILDGTATDWTRLQLAQLYQKGLGIPTDQDAAIRLLLPLAEKGHAEAQFLLASSYFARLTQQLNNAESGKPDPARLKALATLPASERKDETSAASWLWKAAMQELPEAQQELAGQLGLLITGIPRDTTAKLFTAAGKADWVKPLQQGSSLTSLKLRRDVIRDPKLGEIVTAAAEKAACIDESPQLMELKLSRPLAQARYLQLATTPPTNFTLIAGNWQETWEFGSCGKRYPVALEFVSDGLGGASYTIVSASK
ncbi:hypothetical protein IGB42_01645 [Andreprevotia sp. IGB-42]|uniref:tetratricopeptide repeat protein n=1 Tax=Andreprevotia sp. IGB-42 TaxID=2497473 RepID=UPI00135B94A8|nr:hypothetical protein [Andreprevotia sp. IGB-42]KAF0813966.1 hypothetical protein IGB42_01645 [Andreprevotia sp. IGB-42]